MKEFFKADDFGLQDCKESWMTDFEAARISNAKLSKLIDEAPVVYSSANDEDVKKISTRWHHDYTSTFNTHSARLICVEPIVKKECEHLRVETLPNLKDRSNHRCLDCEKWLIRKWEVVDE